MVRCFIRSVTMLKGLFFTICIASIGGYALAQFVQAAQHGLVRLFS
jgi:hypothetical protein